MTNDNPPCAFCVDRPGVVQKERKSQISGKLRLVWLCDQCAELNKPRHAGGVETLDRPARARGKRPTLDFIEREQDEG
jgi:hypothetical protein